MKPARHESPAATFAGDRIHFGLAAEQATSEGYKVEMVVVGEDCAISHPGLAGRRGLAGDSPKPFISPMLYLVYI